MGPFGMLGYWRLALEIKTLPDDYLLPIAKAIKESTADIEEGADIGW